MRKLWLVASLLMLLPLVGFAQDAPRVEVFGGYSYLREDDDFLAERNLHGWNASVAGNVNKWFGIKADFSGHYNDFQISPGIRADLNTHLFLGGGQFSYRKAEAVTPFVHAMIGAARASVRVPAIGTVARTSTSDVAFALALGGGLDVKLTKALAWRAFQADYILTTFNDLDDDRQHNLRISTGLVLRLGDQ